MTILDRQLLGAFLGCLFAFIAFIMLCLNVSSKEKYKKTLYLVVSFLSFGIAVLAVCGAVFDSVKFTLAVIILVGISLAILTIDYRHTYRKCNVMVTAVLTDYYKIVRSMPHSYTPTFAFEYNGKSYKANDLQFYYKRKFFRSFVVGNNYNVFINPQDPSGVCVYKQMKNYVIFVGFALSVVVIAFGIYIVIVA